VHAVFLNPKVRDIALRFVFIWPGSTTTSGETFLVILELAQSSLLSIFLWHWSGRCRPVAGRSRSSLSEEVTIGLGCTSRVCAIGGIHLGRIAFVAALRSVTAGGLGAIAVLRIAEHTKIRFEQLGSVGIGYTTGIGQLAA
jgi:hypothetical protein